MILKEFQDLLLDAGNGNLMISSENVANVNCNNNLYHVFLVLSQVKYSLIPVIDNEWRIQGVISMPMIINAIMGIDSIQYEEMEKLKVKEVMSTEVPVVSDTAELEEIMRKLTNHNFLCVVDESGFFLGIITRKEMLSRINHLLHEFHRYYDIKGKRLSEMS